MKAWRSTVNVNIKSVEMSIFNVKAVSLDFSGKWTFEINSYMKRRRSSLTRKRNLLILGTNVTRRRRTKLQRGNRMFTFAHFETLESISTREYLLLLTVCSLTSKKKRQKKREKNCPRTWSIFELQRRATSASRWNIKINVLQCSSATKHPRSCQQPLSRSIGAVPGIKG